jgi:hypothetical protein
MPSREAPELDAGWYNEMYGRFLRASWVAGKREAQMARRINDLRNRRLSLEGSLFQRDSEGNHKWIGGEAERGQIDSINRDLFAMMGEYQDYLAERIR